MPKAQLVTTGFTRRKAIGKPKAEAMSRNRAPRSTRFAASSRRADRSDVCRLYSAVEDQPASERVVRVDVERCQRKHVGQLQGAPAQCAGTIDALPPRKWEAACHLNGIQVSGSFVQLADQAVDETQESESTRRP